MSQEPTISSSDVLSLCLPKILAVVAIILEMLINNALTLKLFISTFLERRLQMSMTLILQIVVMTYLNKVW